MYYKLLLGLMLSAIFAVTVSAQSSSRASSGSSSRGSSSAAASRAAAYEKKLAKEADREYLKVAKKIAKNEFAPIKLTRPQLNTLKEAVATNYQTLTGLDRSMVQFIPADKRKALQRSYKKMIREGVNEMEAMSGSMEAVGISESSQLKVLELSKTKMQLMETVKSSVTALLTPEQTQALSASMSEEMKSDKMTDKKMEGEETSDAMMADEKMKDQQGSKSKEETMKDDAA